MCFLNGAAAGSQGGPALGRALVLAPLRGWLSTLLPVVRNWALWWGLIRWRSNLGVSKDVRVSFLQFLQNSWPVLCLGQTALTQLYWLKNLSLEGFLRKHRNDFLENVVPELVQSKLLHQKADSLRVVFSFDSKASLDGLVFDGVGAVKNLGDLRFSLCALKTLLNDVWWEFELAEAHKVFCNHFENLFVALSLLKLKYILNEVISKCIFDKVGKLTYNGVCKSDLLARSPFFQASLHHTTSVLVSPDLVAVLDAGGKNELGKLHVALASWNIAVLGSIRSTEIDQECLKNVIAVRIRRQSQHFWSEVLNNAENFDFQTIRVVGKRFN